MLQKKIQNIINQYKAGFVVTGLFLFHTINNIIVIKKDISPPTWDAYAFYYDTINLSQMLSHGVSLQSFNIFKIYPPLFNLLSLPSLYFFGLSYDSAVTANIFFLLILLCSIYGIGKELYDTDAGLLAAFITSFLPAIFGFSRIYWLTFPLTAITSLSIYLLLKTKYLLSRKYVFSLGIVIGLSLLIKWSFPVYFFAPFLVYLMNAIKKYRTDKQALKKMLVHLFFIFLCTVSIAYFWYAPHISTVVSQKIVLLKNPSFLMQHIRETRYQELVWSIKLLFHSFINFLLYPFYLLAFIIAFGKFIMGKYDKKLLIYSCILPPCLLFLLVPPPYESGIKSTRFLVPVLPYIALMISISICGIKNSIIKNLGIILIVTVTFFSFFYLSYITKRSITFYSDSKIPTAQYYWERQIREGMLNPQTQDWKVNEIIQYILADHKRKPIHIMFLQDLPPVSGGIIAKNIEQKLGFTISNPIEQINEGNATVTYNYAELFDNIDYVITYSPDIDLSDKTLTEEFYKIDTSFILLKNIGIPEGFRLFIYKKIKP